jgi:hypothetical protein
VKRIKTLIAPLHVTLPRVRVKDKRWILNLNNYRNAPFHLLNDVKKEYKRIMSGSILAMPELSKIAVRFVVFPKTARRYDIPNVASIHDKFFMDALVELGKLPDDTFEHYVEANYRHGGKDAANPRVEIEIYEI